MVMVMVMVMELVMVIVMEMEMDMGVGMVLPLHPSLLCSALLAGPFWYQRQYCSHKGFDRRQRSF